MRNPTERKESGPGVPEAVPRGLQLLLARYGGPAIDRVWIFPPLVSGRRESGLLVASVFVDGPEADRRVLVSSPYSAERTGKGLRVDWSTQEQGEAPADRFPRMVEGVVRRAEKDLGEPEELVVEGDGEALLEVLRSYGDDLLDPELPPSAPKSPATTSAGVPAGAEDPTGIEAEPAAEIGVEVGTRTEDAPENGAPDAADRDVREVGAGAPGERP